MSNQPYGTLRWNRRVLITLVAVLMTAGSVTADSPGFVVTGRLSANDQEADEGYFALGSEITIVVRPHSTAHVQFRALAGKDVELSVLPAKQ